MIVEIPLRQIFRKYYPRALRHYAAMPAPVLAPKSSAAARSRPARNFGAGKSGAC
jgi:hypothetical protein